MASALSGAMSRICWKMLAARGASPVSRISSAIAINGSISASTAASDPSMRSCVSSWSSAFLIWPSLR